MTSFILTPLARRDVGDIRDYIARDDVAAAERVVDAL